MYTYTIYSTLFVLYILVRWDVLGSLWPSETIWLWTITQAPSSPDGNVSTKWTRWLGIYQNIPNFPVSAEISRLNHAIFSLVLTLWGVNQNRKLFWGHATFIPDHRDHHWPFCGERSKDQGRWIMVLSIMNDLFVYKNLTHRWVINISWPHGPSHYYQYWSYYDHYYPI